MLGSQPLRNGRRFPTERERRTHLVEENRHRHVRRAALRISLDKLVHLARDLAHWRERQQAVGSDAGVGAARDVELRAESGVDERAAVARVVLTRNTT